MIVKRIIFVFAMFSGLLYNYQIVAQISATLNSGNLRLDVYKTADSKYNLLFNYGNKQINNLDQENPVYLEVKGKKLSGKYLNFQLVNDSLICTALLTSIGGTQFSITDKYVSLGNDKIRLERNISILKAIPTDYFNSFFGFQSANGNALTDNEFFVPGVWYKGNFDPEVNLKTTVPQSNDIYFLYREDRITLPLVMFRNKNTGITTNIVHSESVPETITGDNSNVLISASCQYGALGVKQLNDTTLQTFVYPGSEADTKSGRGYRYHPSRIGLLHKYNLLISFSNTPNYETAMLSSWDEAFNLYNPKIYTVNLTSCYDGLIETLLKYYVPNSSQGGIRDAAGFPFAVSLKDFLPSSIDYDMGWVGMQIPTGYYLYREGIEKGNGGTQLKGDAILNFWANNCISSTGLPRAWYDPGLNGANGSFRQGSNLRDVTAGMEGLLSAWCFAKKNNISKSYWLQACTRFGNWLVSHQNTDGSYYFSYNHSSVVNGKNPAIDTNKYITICAIRYLIELYIATDNIAFKDAALKAGEWCYANIHQNYYYLSCVIDNPHSYDSESGQMALNGFLSLYDLTNDSKWLTAAEQAAIYTLSWVYSYEIPVENDQTLATSFPKDRSIVGQHLIAIGQKAADLGFAWSSFAFYHLYLSTGKDIYLQAARISAHNTKQSMNWDQTLYPGQARGLQLEAFPVTIPRRMNGVESALNWNYAAHLDPMFRLKDAFGTPDLEEVNKMPQEEQLRMINIYSKVQSSNYGQNVNSKVELTLEDMFNIYPNPIGKNDQLTLEIPSFQSDRINLSLYNSIGIKVSSDQIQKSQLPFKKKISMNSGQYIVKINGEKIAATKKLIIK